MILSLLAENLIKNIQSIFPIKIATFKKGIIQKNNSQIHKSLPIFMNLLIHL